MVPFCEIYLSIYVRHEVVHKLWQGGPGGNGLRMAEQRLGREARLAYEEAYAEAIEGIEPRPALAPGEAPPKDEGDEEANGDKETPLHPVFIKPRRQRTMTEAEVVEARSQAEVDAALRGEKPFLLQRTDEGDGEAEEERAADGGGSKWISEEERERHRLEAIRLEQQRILSQQTVYKLITGVTAVPPSLTPGQAADQAIQFHSREQHSLVSRLCSLVQELTLEVESERARAIEGQRTLTEVLQRLVQQVQKWRHKCTVETAGGTSTQ